MQEKGSQFYQKDSLGRKPYSSAGQSSQHEDWWGGDSKTSYTHVNSSGDPDVEMDVLWSGPEGSTEYRVGDRGLRDRSFADTQAADANRRGEIPGQQALFNHTSSGRKGVVDFLRSSESLSGRTSAMSAVGMAINDAARRGSTLEPSSSLSPHSQAVTDHLGATPTNVRPNTMTFSGKDHIDGLVGADLSDHIVVPQEEATAGRNTIRSVLGRKSRSAELPPTLF